MQIHFLNKYDRNNISFLSTIIVVPFQQYYRNTRQHIGFHPFLEQSMPSGEEGGVMVVLAVFIVAVHQVVLGAEETPSVFSVEVGNTIKLMSLHLLVCLTERLVDNEFRSTIFTGTEERVDTHVLAHDLTDVKGRIDQNFPIPMHLLGKHSSHRGAYDDERVCFPT